MPAHLPGAEVLLSSPPVRGGRLPGGMGIVGKAFVHGVPTVMVPSAADQPENAPRCWSGAIARRVG